MSRVIPSDAYLDTFAISTTTPDEASAAVTEPTTTGSRPSSARSQTGGKAAHGRDALASTSRDSSPVKGWVNPWMNTLTQGRPTSNAYAFTASVDLTDEVVTAAGQGGRPCWRVSVDRSIAGAGAVVLVLLLVFFLVLPKMSQVTEAQDTLAAAAERSRRRSSRSCRRCSRRRSRRPRRGRRSRRSTGRSRRSPTSPG